MEAKRTCAGKKTGKEKRGSSFILEQADTGDESSQMDLPGLLFIWVMSMCEI